MEPVENARSIINASGHRIGYVLKNVATGHVRSIFLTDTPPSPQRSLVQSLANLARVLKTPAGIPAAGTATSAPAVKPPMPVAMQKKFLLFNWQADVPPPPNTLAGVVEARKARGLM